MGRARWVLAALVLFLVTGCCFQTRYLAQAARGQWQLSRAARPVDEVIADPATPERVRELLREVPAIRAFAEERGLTATKSYRHYVALERPAVSWAVTACEPLRFREKLWRFPVVGSVPYLGFFRKKDARKYARELRREGWDVEVRGVATYSTLGWFADPITSAMLPEGEHALGGLVEVLLHESVHATIYLDDQTTFNESLASFVAPRLTAEYLAGEEAERRAWEEDLARIARVDSALHAAWSTLDALYRSDASEDQKRRRKEEILGAVSAHVGFPVNNATLVEARTYGAGIPELEALWAACGREWPAFWKAIRSLRASDFPRKQVERLGPVLAPLAGQCAAPTSTP